MDYTVLVELGGDLPFDRLCALLRAIERLGSINRAAADLKLSYRHAWGLIKEAESRLGLPLLQKRVGGVEGGGAALTGAARDLLHKYEQFRATVEAGARQIFRGAPESDTTLPVLLASTIGPAEAGIVAALEEAFYQAEGILVRHIAAGSGQALAIGREGRVDLVLAHAPELETAFLAEGYGTARLPLMYNDFLLLGPDDDPAGARMAVTAASALGRIEAAGSLFCSRGDLSGTHVKELAVWRAAGIEPAAPWYRICPNGSMGSTACLRYAEELGAYVLVDRATYLGARARGLALAVVHAGDPSLRNEFALIPINPARFPAVQQEGAARFAAWATGPQGQALIARFGADRFGEPLFFPANSQ